MISGDDAAFLSIAELGAGLRKQQYTAVELAEYFLARLEKLGRPLNAVVELTSERAMAEAAQADRELAAGMDRGPLHGIPYGAKDLLATKGACCTWGAAPLRNQRFDADATIVARLHEAGAVLVAKLAMVELAGGLGYTQANASFTGPGLNPWKTDAWSGGSSSGSGAAVAAGLVPFALGSETWGSIMTPAAYCGITGLRPTYGRVSRAGAMALAWSLDRLGPMARTAEDCGLVLAAIAGVDPDDPTTVDRPFHYPTADELAGRPLKLALVDDAANDVEPEIRANFEQSLNIIGEGATLASISLPDLPYAAVAGTLIDCEGAAAFEPLLVDGRVWEMTAPEDRIGLHAGMLIPATDYIHAQRIRRHIARAVDEVLRGFDAVVAPSLANVAPPSEGSFHAHRKHHGGRMLSAAETCAGLPAISMPNGLGRDGLPTGVKLVGRAFDESRLLAIARAYQQRTDWHRRRPPAAG